MDYIPITELAFRVLLLPEISRGARLEGRAPVLSGPMLRARQLVDLWKVRDGEVTRLEQAWRFLSVDDVTGAIAFALPEQSGDPRNWIFPNLEILLSILRKPAWEAMRAGTLTVEGIKGPRGKRYQQVLPAELARLRPDWTLNRLRRDAADEYIEVQVRQPTPDEAQKGPWRDHATDAAVMAAVGEIAKEHAPGAPPPAFSDLLTEVQGICGDATRAQVRAALEKYPQLRGRRGYSSKSEPRESSSKRKPNK
jgi:hypothetical protein